MEDLLGIVVPLSFVAIFLALGFFIGGWRERSHIKNLDDREANNGDFLISQIKTCVGATSGGPEPTMLVGEAVIGSDYLKTFLGKLRNIFGGEVLSYQTLLERARREALQRIVEQATASGYNAVCNVRFQNADVGGNTANAKKKIVMASILATATAYRHG